MFFFLVLSKVAKSEGKWYAANYIFAALSLFPCLSFSSLSLQTHNYLIIKLVEAVLVCLHSSFIHSVWADGPLPNPLPLCLSHASPSVSVFQTVDVVWPMIRNSLHSVPPSPLCEELNLLRLEEPKTNRPKVYGCNEKTWHLKATPAEMQHGKVKEMETMSQYCCSFYFLFGFFISLTIIDVS